MKKNRGKAPSDHVLFNEKFQTVFYEAISDLSFLLSRGYGVSSSLHLVGGRYRLNARQQKALQGMSASSASILLRKKKEVFPSNLEGKEVIIDGFNVLIILESALSGAYLFEGQDGAFRDVTSVHGGYKKVIQTNAAILLVGRVLQQLKIKKAIWYLDAPISNSGRLKTHLREIAEQENFPWEIHLDNNPDKVLIDSDKIMISSDAWILEDGKKLFNLIKYIIRNEDVNDLNLFYSKPPRKIALVTCVKEKLNDKSLYPAKDLYQGILFGKFMAEANAEKPDLIFILSGKYGLLSLDDEIETYDVNLNVQTEEYKIKWSKKVLEKLKHYADFKRDEFVFITNKEYARHLIPSIKKYRFPIEIK